MIRVFKANDRDFTTNGEVVIVPIKARVKNNINGDFTLELVCNSKYNDYLKENDLLIVPTPQGEQAFRISNNVQKKGDRITLKLKHVFYDSDNLVIADSYAVDMTCKQALNHFNNATDTTSPFTCDSDITHIDSFRCVRKSFLECINTILERWGGFLIRDNWKIAIKSEIGRDNGVTIRYKKNLQELTATYDYSTVVTKLLPVGKDGILLPELYVYAPTQYEVPYSKVISFEQDIDEEDYPTETAYQNAVITDLRAQAQKYVNKAYKPTVTYSLKGKPAKVSDIGDIIRVYDERIGVDITTEVISYEWDIITESYVNLTFGNFGEKLSSLMSTIKSNTNAQINEATNEIKGVYNGLLQGSYIVYRGYDILVLDNVPISSASHVLRFANNGISISLNGVNGTYYSIYDLSSQVLSVPTIRLNGQDLQALLNSKQDALTAGDHIVISRVNGVLTIATTDVASVRETNDSDYERLAPFDVRNNDTIYFIKDRKEIRFRGTSYGADSGGGGGGSGLNYWKEADATSASSVIFGYKDREGSLYGIYGTQFQRYGSIPAKDTKLGLGYNVLVSPYTWQSKNNSQYQTVECESYYTGCNENINPEGATIYPEAVITNYGRYITNNTIRADRGIYTQNDFYYITQENMNITDFVDGCGTIQQSVGLKDYFQRKLVAGNGITLTLLSSGKYRIESNLDYTNLTNKPQINSVELTGNKTSKDLGLLAGAYMRIYNPNTYQTRTISMYDSNNNIYLCEGSGITFDENSSISGTTDKLITISSKTTISPSLGNASALSVSPNSIVNLLNMNLTPNKTIWVEVNVEFYTEDGSALTDGVFEAWISASDNSDVVLPYNGYPSAILKDMREYMTGKDRVILRFGGVAYIVAQTSGGTTSYLNVRHNSSSTIKANYNFSYYAMS